MAVLLRVMGPPVSRIGDYAAPSVPTALRTFYVDGTSGSDAAAGTSSGTAWRTLAKANTTAIAGDEFLLRGTFTNQVIRPANSGTSANRITYKKEPGQTPVLSGGVDFYNADLGSRSYCVLDGLELTGGVDYSVNLWPNATFNWLRNLNVHDVASGVRMIVSSNDNRVEDCVFTEIGDEALNSGDAVAIFGNCDRNVIVRNTINYCGHNTIMIGVPTGLAAGTCDDNIVALNEMFNPWATGVSAAGYSLRTIIEGNTIHDTADGTGAVPIRAGIDINGNDNIVRYNRVWNTGDSPIRLVAYRLDGSNLEDCIGNHVYHNTFWAAASGAGAVVFMEKDDANNQDNIVENNIFWDVPGFDGGNGSFYPIRFDLYHADTPWTVDTTNGNIVRNNIFPIGSAFVHSLRFAGSQYYTKAQAESAFAGWVSNQQADPAFVNQAGEDVRLQAGSPAIDTGQLVSGVTYNGSAPDLGAIEYGSSTP